MFLEDLFNGIGDALGGLFGASNGSPLQGIKDPSAWWEQFKNGQTNEVNKEIAEENLEYQRERAAVEDERYEEETAYNREFAENERDYQREMAEDERNYQREMDAYNQAFAEDERDYQRNFAEDEREYNRALQQQLFDREDTALERQASSLSKLGINPLSQQMNGLGAGSVVSTSAPAAAAAPSHGSSGSGFSSAPSASGRGGQALHNDFKMQDMGVLQALTPLASLANTINQVATGQGQRDLLRAQTDKQNLDNFITAYENGIWDWDNPHFKYYQGQATGPHFYNRKNTEMFWKEQNMVNEYMNKYKPDFARNMDYLLSDSFYESAEKALTKGSKLFDKAFNDGIKDESKKHNNPFSMFMNLFF